MTHETSMTYEELRDLDVRRGKASMDWYRAMRARHRGEMAWEDFVQAEARVREMDAELRRAFDDDGVESTSSRLNAVLDAKGK